MKNRLLSIASRMDQMEDASGLRHAAIFIAQRAQSGETGRSVGIITALSHFTLAADPIRYNAVEILDADLDDDATPSWAFRGLLDMRLTDNFHPDKLHDPSAARGRFPESEARTEVTASYMAATLDGILRELTIVFADLSHALITCDGAGNSHAVASSPIGIDATPSWSSEEIPHLAELYGIILATTCEDDQLHLLER